MGRLATLTLAGTFWHVVWKWLTLGGQKCLTQEGLSRLIISSTQPELGRLRRKKRLFFSQLFFTLVFQQIERHTMTQGFFGISYGLNRYILYKWRTGTSCRAVQWERIHCTTGNGCILTPWHWLRTKHWQGPRELAKRNTNLLANYWARTSSLTQ